MAKGWVEAVVGWLFGVAELSVVGWWKWDGKYKYGEMQCQNIDNQDVRNYIQRTHIERNKNPIYDYYMDAEKENKDTQKYAENDNQETREINN